MSKRIPPSAEQIEQALTDHLMRLPAEHARRTVVPVHAAQRILAKAFSTTLTKAYDWLLDIAASDNHPVEVLRIGGAGCVDAVLRAGTKPGKVTWKPLAEQYGYTLMTYTPRLQEAWYGGRVDDADTKYSPAILRPSENAEFVAVARFFTPIVAEYADRYAASRVTRETELILQGATAEHEHGPGLAYIRGLLDAAGAQHPDPEDLLQVRYTRRGGRVTIELVGDAIDQVGDLLRQLGVQPKAQG